MFYLKKITICRLYFTWIRINYYKMKFKKKVNGILAILAFNTVPQWPLTNVAFFNIFYSHIFDKSNVGHRNNRI